MPLDLVTMAQERARCSGKTHSGSA